MKLLAHSAQPKKSLEEQTYNDHVIGVIQKARNNTGNMLEYRQNQIVDNCKDAVDWAACFHDLGKLDKENQNILNGQRTARHLSINHVDAGVAYLKEKKKMLEAALLVFSHHHGLPSIPNERTRISPFRDISIKKYIDGSLDEYLLLHENEVNVDLTDSKHPIIQDGLSRRLIFSCLVDADHSDSANYSKPDYNCRWPKRLEKLDMYVRVAYENSQKGERDKLRNKIFLSCRNGETDQSTYYCDSPVGTGKTTAVMAHLLQAAIRKNLRHIIVILPYTNIITQSVKVYREALVLDGEDPEAIIAEHDHQADFSSFEARELATLWNAPIIVTTAVQFFETLGSNKPSKLRKLHQLPGSGIFIDESHAAMPTWLWPQAWVWLQKLTKDWGCHLVLASGTTVKFWRIPGFFGEQVHIPELICPRLRRQTYEYEKRRVKLKVRSTVLGSNERKQFNTVDELVSFIASKQGPRIVIMNTVFSAAYLAYIMRNEGFDVLHLSTSLTPKDRIPIIKEIYRRLKKDGKSEGFRYKDDWTLVATSCAEAGLNFSFKNGFAELRSVQSFLQISGRVNREGEYNDSKMYCFSINDTRMRTHPGFKTSQKVFEKILEEKLFNKMTISELVTEAFERELKEDYSDKIQAIQCLEKTHQYPEVSNICRIIESDTRLVVVDPLTIERLESGENVSSIQLLRNSVQIWATRVSKLNLTRLNGYKEIYRWFDNGYDPRFLGYMEAILDFEQSNIASVLII